MVVSENDRENIEDEMWDRLKTCIQQLQEMEAVLIGDERTMHCHTRAKEKISEAMALVDAFEDSLMGTEEKNQVNEALESAEQYLETLRELISVLSEVIQKEKETGERLEEALEKKEDESEDEWTHILHLSDVHFGIYMKTGNDEQEKREFFDVIEEQLFPFLKHYTENNHPIDIVAITGDISYSNREAGYSDFKDWLEKLCGILNVDIKNHVVMCPGNHDKDCKGKKRVKDGLIPEGCGENKISELLTIDEIRNRQDQFRFYNDICKKLNIEPLKNFDTYTSKRTVPYVMGIKEIEGICFIVLNSAWNSFPRDDENSSDHGQLLLGRRPIKFLLKDAKIPEEKLKVMLFHHPLAWLHEAEIRIYGKDQEKPTAALVRQNADIILNGHVHGGIEPPDILANKTVVFGSGTLYTKDSHLNQFEIISINRTRHYCQQTVVCYNSQELQGHLSGWELTETKYPPKIYYGISRDMRDLLTKYSLGEITMAEAQQEAAERSAEVGLKMIRELLERSRFRPIKIMQEDVKEDIRLRETASDTLEESLDKTKK